MKKEDKAKAIEKLQSGLAGSKVVVATDYRGLTAAEMTRLRRQLGEAGVEFRVVKNTLTRLAGAKVGIADMGPLLEGPTAMAFGVRDEIAPARAVTSYIRASRSNLRIKGGVLGRRLLTPAEVQSLAALPSREVLIGRALGQLKAPLAVLTGMLASPLRGLVGVLQARMKQVGA